MARANRKVVVIGGGITGLTTAFYLQQQLQGQVEVLLLERGSTLGGKISSLRQGGFLVEGGPDSFLAKKTSTLDLCHELGLDDQLTGSKQAQHPTYVWSRGKLHSMPEGMMLMAPTMIRPFLRSRLISWPGKIRMGCELLIPPAQVKEDESLGSFVRRRLGAELLDKIAAPLMAGIYAADPETLSLQSTFPMFPEMEQKYGGLVRSMLKQRRQKPGATTQADPTKGRSMFLTLRGGMQQLVDTLLGKLRQGTILPNQTVAFLTREADHYRVHLTDGTSVLADDVVLATPAYIAADILQGIEPTLAAKLREIRYVSTATVSLGFRRSDIAHPLDGYGFVVPFSEQRQITACTWASQKFDNRAAKDCVLIRVFIGGARAENLAEQDEATLIQLARQELRITMNITAEPLLAKAFCWRKSTPQYEVGHKARVAEIEHVATRHPGLHLAGAAFHGAGIPDCIQSGANVAKAIINSYSRHEVQEDDPAIAPLACTQ